MYEYGMLKKNLKIVINKNVQKGDTLKVLY